MKRALVVLALLAGCKKAEAPAASLDSASLPLGLARDERDGGVRAPADAAHVAEQAVLDAGWSDTTSAASMVAASHQGAQASLPPPPPSAALPELTIATPFPHGDFADAKVAVVRGDDPAAMVERALTLSEVVIPTDRPVVIKLNAHGFDRMKPGKPDDGVTNRIVSAKFVAALVAALRARGVTDLTLADGGFTDADDLKKLLALSGYQRVMDDAKVPFVDLDHWTAERPPHLLHLPWAKRLKDELVVSSYLVDPDRKPFVIDVAKLKAHRFAVMSLSIKNLMGASMLDPTGTINGRRRWRMHAELSPWLDAWKKSKQDDRKRYRDASRALAERLADAYGAINPELAIIEGLPAVDGDGFAKVHPFGDHGIVIASQNGCHADLLAAQFFQLDDSDVLEREIGFRLPPAISEVATRWYGGPAGLSSQLVVGDLDWLGQERPAAWYRAMAPFELNPPAKAPAAAK